MKTPWMALLLAVAMPAFGDQHLLGESEAARRWLRKLADRLPATYWEGVELKLLQREAEAFVLSGPESPSQSSSH